MHLTYYLAIVFCCHYGLPSPCMSFGLETIVHVLVSKFAVCTVSFLLKLKSALASWHLKSTNYQLINYLHTLFKRSACCFRPTWFIFHMQNFSHGHAIALPPTAPGSPVPSWAQVTGSVYFVQFSTFLPSPKTQECQPLGLNVLHFILFFSIDAWSKCYNLIIKT